jgi:hypothetical protein
VSLASVCLRKAALSHGGGLGGRRMALCGNVAVVEAVVVEARVIVEAGGKRVQAMRQAMGKGHVDGEEIIEMQRHVGHFIGGRAAESHVCRVVFHDELANDEEKAFGDKASKGRGADEAL